jgi:phosphatidylglycerophosphatase A
LPVAARHRDLKRVAAYTFATWFGCGLVPKAPGTVGTLGAVPLYLALRPLGPLAVLGAAAVLGLLGVLAASHVVHDRDDPDPQIVVVDEVAGVLVTLAAAPPTWAALAVGVLLFRVFDQMKPWPARPAEGLPGGFGVVLDDIVAGAWGAAALVVLRALGAL